MKINPIQSVYNRTFNYYSNKTSIVTSSQDEPRTSFPACDNYGRAIAFKRIDPLAKAISNAPFEDKLSVAVGKLKQSKGLGNLLLVAKDMDAIKELLKLVDTPVALKRVLVMVDPNFDETLLFVHNVNKTKFVNTNDYDLYDGNLETISPGMSIKIRPNSFIICKEGWLEIKENHESDLDLEKYSSYFLKEFDFSPKIDTHNKYVLDLIEKLGDEKKSKKPGLTFDSIGGQDEVIESLKKNVLFPLRYPEVFDGFMVSRGVILYGPPGTGKTLLAKTLGAESGASVFELCATDLSNKYVGESEKNCRELFAKAVDAQPSIIYFDEIDALGKARGKDTYGDKLLTQFLSLMSDIEKRGDNVYVIGSTNRKEDLDPAFTRSGRFSTLLEVKSPDLKGTKQILEIHTKGKSIDKDVDLDNIAEKMYAKKMTGADIAATVKEAFSHALERTGIYNSMATDTYSPAMKDFLTINTADFVQSIDEFKNNSIKWAPVGFKK